ncbi:MULTISPECIES: YggT family protein [unclassified Motilimonas]|uniref:YggT family protein n=1 Tax=Motilimonas TaxID=1914248 RepID=UPI001E4CC82A|nr:MULTISPECIES: YggT family protein [unclassified Motilimonas]MCE0558190.1 YggT family protein [Motilimonas sp. E26]MDO6526370.1 YggT family protein [Motilimonas sp. 1_MG-2023]
MGTNPFDFLINTLFDLYISVVILRLWLQVVRADFYNPFCQFVVKATNPLLKPLRRVIPGFGGFDFASVVLLLIIVLAKLLLLQYLNFLPYAMNSVGGLLLITALVALKKIGYLLFWVLIIRAILSWVSQGRSPIEYVMYQLTEPLMAPIRRMLPSMGGLDLSILVIFILLQFINYGMLSLIGPLWLML